ncbi:MAG: hypothetical protein ACOC1P_02375 [Minisyncoccales bacterium]
MIKQLILKLESLEEIFNFFQKEEKKGTVLLLAVIVMATLMILSAYLISFITTESKISNSQVLSNQAYYVAEAGIDEAIWKLKYDTKGESEDGDLPWATCFTTSTASCGNCEGWADSFSTSTDELIEDSFVSVKMENSSTTCGKGKIVATSTINYGDDKKTQRVVETEVYKPLGSPTEGAALFSTGASQNVKVSDSNIEVYGNFFSNNNLDISKSNLEAFEYSSGKGKLLAVRNYKNSSSNVSSSAICAKNVCNTTSTCECDTAEEEENFEECNSFGCPHKSLSIPKVDFDSASSTSFLKRAKKMEENDECRIYCKKEGEATTTCSQKCVFKKSDDFSELLWQVGENGTLTLGSNSTPTITYVQEGIELKGARRLIINGSLVADKSINIGNKDKWNRRGKNHKGNSGIKINRPTETTASGLLSKEEINFGKYSSVSTTTVKGVIYAQGKVDLVSLPHTFIIEGGIIGRKFSLVSIFSDKFKFILDDNIIRYGLGYKIGDKDINPKYSSMVTVEHWEESY